jgi:hypothetical protein
VGKFFPERQVADPRIYAYEDLSEQYHGLLKIGETSRSVPVRVAEQYPTKRPGRLPYRIVLDESAMRPDGSTFSDTDVRDLLKLNGFPNPAGEWVKCKSKDVLEAIRALSDYRTVLETSSLDFKMRPEQALAVEKTSSYLASFSLQKEKQTPHFLWNAKMRFGKTFASYQLAKKMGWRKVLVLTFKPAVQDAWRTDLNHVDFKGWQFISKPTPEEISKIDLKGHLVCFGSFQDFLGKNKSGGIKPRNEWVHATHWDCIILDEYHFGAWRDGAKDLISSEEKEEIKNIFGEGIDYYDEELIPISSSFYLYLSGTPFRAIGQGEFIEEQIYNWTYSDEQKAKQAWVGDDNPYKALPRMVLMTYQLPEVVRNIASQGEFNEFDLSAFFSASGEDRQAKFKFEYHVQKWLDLIRGSLIETEVDNLKSGAQKPPFPFSDIRLRNILTHTLWFLPSIASCDAMKNLLAQECNNFYHQYDIIVAAGKKAGIGIHALKQVREKMSNPIKSKTITLTCGKLLTGVSVAPWSGIFMLRNCSSPETYFQAAFRVQTAWKIKNVDGLSPNKEVILKKECYIFDFAPTRALRQIVDYSCNLDISDQNPEKKVEEFCNFLPILAYDGARMQSLNASAILDIAMSGTSGNLLARRWESARLVNVDNLTLSNLLNNEKAMEALMKVEGFRSIGEDIEVIINKSESIKNLKQKANMEDLSRTEKKQLSSEEKEYKTKRKLIQEKLLKFATRIPIFMYLTDFREYTLKDVITKIEPELFKRVTGLDIPDFELLLSLNVFNATIMNNAVFQFKRYEDASLSYSGITTHDNLSVGLWNTSLSGEEFVNLDEV